MENLIFENYEFEIQSEGNNCSIQFENKEGFAFNKERRKIYIVCNGQDILYIGEANSSLKRRFKNGCDSYNLHIKGQTRGGYKGYKWLNPKNNPHRKLGVYVIIFDEEFDPKEKRPFIEAIEGELVYEVRKKTGKWPKFQNEIHFSNFENTYQIAQNILVRFLLLQNS